MHPPEIIAKKRDGGTLTGDEIRATVRAITDGTFADYQAAALLMAIWLNGFDDSETLAWTEAMLHSGTVLDLRDIPGYKVDKHSTGGVGDKISIPLAPLVASAGVAVPMISGRGLGHTGGTLDKLESIPGFRTDLGLDRFRELVSTLQCGLIGQTAEIAPADRTLYALRDVTSTVESIPLITSSILSKKLAEGIDGLVLDVKVGSGAFMKDIESARRLASTMVRIGTDAGRDVVALLTDMDQPLGRTVGNALEIRESIDILRGEGPADVRELTLLLGTEMLQLARPNAAPAALRAELERHLDDGSAFAHFLRIVEAQGGDPRAIEDPARLPGAAHRTPLPAPRGGWVTGFQTADVGRAALDLGAGRARKEDRIHPGVGIELAAKVGDRVEAGEPLAWLLHEDDGRLTGAMSRLAASITIGEEAPAPRPLLLERITASSA